MQEAPGSGNLTERLVLSAEDKVENVAKENLLGEIIAHGAIIKRRSNMI